MNGDDKQPLPEGAAMVVMISVSTLTLIAIITICYQNMQHFGHKAITGEPMRLYPEIFKVLLPSGRIVR
jgi:hypothetical protein